MPQNRISFMAISPINIASSTASNWLKEAQESIASSENPGGLMGALQSARNDPGSIKSFLANNQSTANNLSLITQGAAQSAGQLAAQMASDAAQKRAADQQALAEKLNPQQQNFTPPKGLDPMIYFKDGSFIDTSSNILTMANGTQIDITTGTQVIDTSSIISMANGAYLDTKNNVLTMSDGTKIDTVTGLKITA
jgi:hypothetical protein